MKAIVCHRYGSPEALRCEDVEKPTAGEDDVLLKVRAAAVNPLDWHLLRGTPYLGRVVLGLRKPRVTRPGRDVAGLVEAVGGNVTRFKPGDAVFGVCRGAFAEYACASQSKLVIKPENVTFAQAAAVPVAALTALQGLRDKGRIQPGQKVLIHGAAGGVGTFAVQIAKAFGAEVTAVCSPRNAEMVRSIGADRVIDRTREDFTTSRQRYDLILDCFATHSLLACRRVLSPGGVYVLVGGPVGSITGLMARSLTALALSRLPRRKLLMLLTRSSPEDLTVLSELLEAGKVKPVLDRRHGLSAVPEAIRYLAEGHARGKIVITV